MSVAGVAERRQSDRPGFGYCRQSSVFAGSIPDLYERGLPIEFRQAPGFYRINLSIVEFQISHYRVRLLESGKLYVEPPMAGSQIERVFSVLESLTSDPRGVPMQALAEQLDIPKSATHRLLAELIRLGYVRQNPENLRYHLTTKLGDGVSLSLGQRRRYRAASAGSPRAGDRRTGAPGRH